MSSISQDEFLDTYSRGDTHFIEQSHDEVRCGFLGLRGVAHAVAVGAITRGSRFSAEWVMVLVLLAWEPRLGQEL